MANEITFSGSLSCYKPSTMSAALGRAFSALSFTMSGLYVVAGTVTVPTTGIPIPLGQVVAPHWAVFNNLDATNYVTLRNGIAGADLVQLLKGEQGIFPLLSSATPYAFANTASCLLEYLILSL